MSDFRRDDSEALRVKGRLTRLGSIANLRSAFALSATALMVTEALAGTAIADATSGYSASMEAGIYAEAANHAKKRIDLVLASEPVDGVAWARALADLGEAQFLGGDSQAAAENFAAAVELLETNRNRLDLSLVRPLTGLARAERAAGDYQAAVTSFQRAIHVQQVNLGPHAIEQAGSVDALSRIFFEIGDFERANAMQLMFVSLHHQAYPNDILRQLPALHSQAEMFTRTNRYADAQKVYLRMLAGIEKQEGRRSLDLLPAMYAYADLLMTHHISDGRDGNYTARRFLRRAVHIVEKREDASPVEAADAYIAMGDFFATRTGDRRAALRYYERGWNALASDNRYRDALEERFGRATHLNPVPVDTVPLMHDLLRSAVAHGEPEPTARIAATFDVDSAGVPQNIAIIEGDPTGYLDTIVVDHIEKFVFRPAFHDGEPTGSEGLVFEIGAYDAHARADARQNTARESARR